MGEVSQGKRQSVALIPAYNPPRALLALVDALKRKFDRVVVVDDGSTEGHDVLSEVERKVDGFLRHSENRGKGAALKLGFEHIGERNVVTVDADGQHRIGDIIRVADSIEASRRRLVIGVRAFSGKVPLRSRFGNFWTRWFFFLATGILVKDTQTGLRGIPASLVSRIASIPGERYEYEMAMLADSVNHDEKPLEIPIETVYIDGNQTSHFKPLADTVRIYRTFFGFCLSGLTSFLLDNAVFALSVWWMSQHDVASRRYEILFSICLARLVSSNFNYLCNRFMVFQQRQIRDKGPKRRHVSFIRYWMLVAGMMVASFAFTGIAAALFDVDGVAITVVKIAVETALLGVSFHLQRKLVFRR